MESRVSSAEKSEEAAGKDRRAHRERAFLQARISFAGGSMSYPCFVTQISATGAKIALDAQVSLPERFHITIAQRNVDREARRVWQKEGSAALVFLAPEKSVKSDVRDLERRLRALEAENARLRAQISALSTRLKDQAEGY